MKQFEIEAKEELSLWGDFSQAIQTLREEIPPGFPVSVRRVKLSSHGGDTDLKETKKGKRFIIRISKFLSNNEAILILLHEWAHALAWTWEHDTINDHGPEWGVAYARVYRIFTGYL